MPYQNFPSPMVVPIRTDARGVTWVLCEDCTRLLPATRRHGGPARVIPHLSDPQLTGRSHAQWPARRREARRRVWRCQGGDRFGLVSGSGVTDVCAGCPVAAATRGGAAEAAEAAVAAPPPPPAPPGELNGQTDLLTYLDAL